MSGITSRRDFLKTGAIFGGLAAAGTVARAATPHSASAPVSIEGKALTAVPSSCWQCVSRDAIVCFVEEGRLVKIEGNPRSIRNRGKICARGQAGINQVYDPDRVLYPLRRVGKRGGGRWRRVSWDEALAELTTRLRALREAGTPEKFMFHYGRMKGSDATIVQDFLRAYGTGTVGNHTSICEGGKWVAQELTWGKYYDVWDFEYTNLIVNFGSNFFEAHTSHIQAAQRAVEALARGAKLYTFDVRLSHTAAKSTEWIPIRPGTDLAVLLAMTHVVLTRGLYDETFINDWTTTSVAELKEHYRSFTPAWAEAISGVPASKIEEIAVAFGKAKPAVIATYRGAVAHYNSVLTERAKLTLEAICGYLNKKGGTNVAVAPKWKTPTVTGETKKLKILDGPDGAVAFPNHHVNHQIFKMIKEGSHGRPEVYMVYCHNPVYVNGECAENVAIVKDESLIPFIVAVDAFYSETTALADLILPDVTYLERWSWDDAPSFAMVPEFYIRQPAVKPLGEARQFQDVVCELARRLGLDLGYGSAQEYIAKSCELTGLGFEKLKAEGVWYDAQAKPAYGAHAKELKPEEYQAEDILYDEETGVYWNWKKSGVSSREEAVAAGYRKTKNAYKGYVGQRIGDKVYEGFVPDKVNKSGKLEVKSPLLAEKGFPALPAWMDIPDHQNLPPDAVILTTFKVAFHTQSRTTNCKWLTELYHDNAAWLHPETAARFGIADGGKIRLTSAAGELVTTARVTEGIVPGVVAISNHLGHWEYGENASGKAAASGHVCGPDCETKWWNTYGVHPNWVIPNRPDPIGGQQRWMDTVVKISAA